jgi:hypothetical protein
VATAVAACWAPEVASVASATTAAALRSRVAFLLLMLFFTRSSFKRTFHANPGFPALKVGPSAFRECRVRLC